jgi:protein O-mannosyl-transferase
MKDLKKQLRGTGLSSVNNPIEFQRGRLTFLGVLTIVLLGTILYSNILHAPFIFDDYDVIVDNDTIKRLPEALRDIASNRYLTVLSFALNYALHGLKPLGYHLINNLIHIVNAVLVYYFVILSLRTPQLANHNVSAPFIAFFSAFVFISHPVQTQAVTYVVQRATSMATMFYLISLVMYIKARLLNQNLEFGTQKQKERQKIAALKFVLFYLTSIISAILAMKTKQISFTLPIIIILYEFSFFNETPDTKLRTSKWKRFLFLFPILLTILIIPLSILNIKGHTETIGYDIDIQSRETINISRADYLITQFRVIMTYLRLLTFPANQSLDYIYPVYHSFFDPQVFLSFGVLSGIFCFGMYLVYYSQSRARILRFAAFGIFWFFITLSVESSIIPVKDVIFEHRLYLPSIGFFIAFIVLTEHILPYRKVKVAFMITIVILLSVTTYQRNTTWKDPQLLWEDAVTKFPDNPRAYNHRGIIFKEEGEFQKAIEQSEKSLRINHRYAPALYNLGDIQFRLGNYEAAVTYFKKVIELKLTSQLYLATLNSLGMAQSEMGDAENAVNTFKEALRLFPSSVIPYNNLGRQYIKMGKFDQAIEILGKGLRIREEPHLRSNLSLAFDKKRERDKNLKNID